MLAGSAAAFEVRTVALETNDAVFHPLTGRLYASVSGDESALFANSLVEICPETGQVVSSLFLGNEPGILAVAGHEPYLYVGLREESLVVQVDVGTMTIKRLLVLEPEFSVPTFAHDIAVIDSREETIAIVLHQREYTPAAVRIDVFSVGIRLPQSEDGWSVSELVFHPGSDQLFSFASHNKVSRFAINGEGIFLLQEMTIPGISSPGAALLGDVLLKGAGNAFRLPEFSEAGWAPLEQDFAPVAAWTAADKFVMGIEYFDWNLPNYRAAMAIFDPSTLDLDRYYLPALPARNRFTSITVHDRFLAGRLGARITMGSFEIAILDLEQVHADRFEVSDDLIRNEVRFE